MYYFCIQVRKATRYKNINLCTSRNQPIQLADTTCRQETVQTTFAILRCFLFLFVYYVIITASTCKAISVICLPIDNFLDIELENKRWDFCFAHLQSCHNGWASNILIVVDTGCAGIHHSKYRMPIYYDTIEDGQNKTSHRLFSNC